jgi:hypothetical protein
MSLSLNFPTVRPTLLLDFAKTQVLDPRITFGRASPATYYDGETTAKAEENILLWSQEFQQTSVWVQSGVTVTANSSTAPDGTTTADKIIPTAVSGTFKELQQNFTVTSGLTYAYSVFVKADGYNFVQLLATNAQFGTFAINYDLSTGIETQFSAGTSTVISRGINSAGNGWYRINVVCTAIGSGSGRFGFDIIPASTSARGVTWTGDGVSGVLGWGAQLEQRAAVTAYTVTTTQPITNYQPVLLTAAAGTARFDFNPVSGESLGLMKESESTNLVLRSEEFDNAYWTKLNTTISANTIVAPDGTLTGDKIIANSGNSVKYIDRAITTVASTTYSWSVYLKAGEYTSAVVYFISGTTPFENCTVTVDLLTGTLTGGAGNAGATYVGSTSTNVGNGWWRISLTGSIGTKTNMLVRVYPNIISTFTGNDWSGLYLWGAQLEAATNASSYIPTTATEVIRLRDDISMTGTNFSSWFNNAQGTMLLDIIKPNTEPSNRFSAALFTSTTNYIGLDYGVNPSQAGVGYWRSSGTITTVAAPAVDMTGGGKYILTYTANDLTITAQGASVASAVPATVIPTMGQLNLGTQTGSTFERTLIYFRKVAYYDVRLPNAQLQSLTRNQ